MQPQKDNCPYQSVTYASHQKLNYFIDNMLICYNATFVPMSQGMPDMVNWSIMLKTSAKAITIKYRQGVGNIAGFKIGKRTVNEEKAQQNLLETGIYHQKDRPEYPTWSRKKIAEPKLIDILFCLTMDASVLDYDDFSTWAGDFGCNPDSISDKATYDLCKSQSIDFVLLLGTENLEKLQKLFQDY